MTDGGNIQRYNHHLQYEFSSLSLLWQTLSEPAQLCTVGCAA